MSLFSVPEYLGMRVTLIRGTDQPGRLVVKSMAQGASCRACGQWSSRTHSEYVRHLQELPVGSIMVTLEFWVHRFFCAAPACAQICERVPWAPTHQRRTIACTRRLLTLAWEMSAAATQRTAWAEGIRVSISTVNRVLRPWRPPWNHRRRSRSP